MARFSSFFHMLLLSAACGAAMSAAAESGLPKASTPTVELKGFPPLESYVLANGLQVFLWPDASTDLVAGNVWYRVGGLQERKGVTGIAHLFEHMMFRPSKFAPEGVMETASMWAADAGATTKYKTTNFTFDMPASKLEDYLRLEADRMSNLPLDSAMLAKEKEAVRSEYLGWDNNPMLILLPVLAHNLFGTHIAGSFVTGERPDLARITAADCVAFYRQNYVPNNATLILTGHFRSEEARRLVATYFWPIRRGQPRPMPPDPASWPKAKLVQQAVPGTAHFLALAFPIPFSRTQDRGLYLALNMLFNERNSLIGRELIGKRKVAADVGFDTDGLGWPLGILVLNKGEDAPAALAGVDEVLRASSRSLSAETATRYAVDFRAGLLRSLQSPAQRAYTLGTYLNYKGGLTGLAADLDAPTRISLNDIKTVIGRYLTPVHRIAVLGTPKG
jgi:zinc protease